MKTRTFISILILVFAVLIIAGSCATGKKAISNEGLFEAWSGTWINTGLKEDQKIVINPNGTREYFVTLTSTTVGWKEKITVQDQWSDSKGTIWYKGHREVLPPFPSGEGYEMGKISNSGNTWELIWASEDYPIEEWEPDRFEYTHRIYQRQ